MQKNRTNRLQRGAGILLPISSLPSPYGIGTFGAAAYEFVDQLCEAGQTYWQVLPIGPTSYGDSPYQSFSTFAGNPYFIDLDMLAEQNLLNPKDLQEVDWGELSFDVDYGKMYQNRYKILQRAFYRYLGNGTQELALFMEQNRDWLEDYSLFMACKDYFGGVEWLKWEEDIRVRKPEAVAYYKDFLKEKIQFWCFLQYIFFQQWNDLKAYANQKGIQIIGDIPIYVALDSADVWANPKQYQLDETLHPVDVAGCPPDAFSDYGQKWGNPLYDWDVMEQDDFAWWRRRMQAASRLYDVIRIDHFIGVVRYYAIPADKAPVEGEYREGPGRKLTRVIDESIGEAKIIAEDLGVVVPGVKQLLEQTGYPGMKILEFAFDGNRQNEYLPHSYPQNCVVYSGTHDNETLLGYFDSLTAQGYQYLKAYTCTTDREELAQEVIRLAYQSVADTVIIQMQDILKKDNQARMNLPSTIGQNWRWRLKPGEFGRQEIVWLRNLSDIYGRCPEKWTDKKEEAMLEKVTMKRYQKKVKDCTNEELYFALLELTKSMVARKEQPEGKKKVYYISAEFLIGKLLSNNLINLGIFEQVKKELEENGKSIYEIEELENEPSLGNGGLGRLAACFLDSIATLGIPGDGIGINYHLGLFKQVFEQNLQKEYPNAWITEESWLTKREQSYTVEFRNHTVQARLYDIAVTGYENRTNQLHLFDIDSVDEKLVKEENQFDKEDIEKNLTLFLYPDDSDKKGQLLRIYQQYFMVSAGAQLILDQCRARGSNYHDLYEYAVIQINDTHPTMIIPELIRLLLKEGIGIQEAMDIVSRTCAYTNHTILAEALEKWPVEYLNEVVPQLMPIIRILDNEVRKKYQDESVYIIDAENRVHMAHIDMHYGFSINGVAYLHTEILKNSELNHFYRIYPKKFNNKTNGITFRRWLLHCNEELAEYITQLIGDGFKKDANELKKLAQFAEDETVLQRLLDIKTSKKKELKQYLQQTQGITIDENSIFDIQVKRLHEYKRQQLNALYIIHKYLDIKRGNKPATPITAIFGAKAAPAYVIAKDIIHLILCLQELIDNDPEVSPYLKVVMVENYNVSKAAKIIPACDISEQISLASKEASGTGNMKFMLNGAVTLGTLDGANVEISDLVGKDNIYVFGEDSETVIQRYQEESYVSREYYEKDAALKEAVDFIVGKEMLSIGKKEHLERLYKELLQKDWFMTFPDFEDYVRTREKAFADYEDRLAWAKKMLVNISQSGFFSSDRTIAQYETEIWKTGTLRA